MPKEKSEKRGKGRIIINMIIVVILLGVVGYMITQFGGTCGIFKIP